MGFYSKARVTKSRSIARVTAPPAAQIFAPNASATLTLTGQTPPDFLAAWQPSAPATLTLTGQIPTWTIPLTIPGIAAWYDATALVGLNDGDPVASWDDLSGNANTLTEATNKPTYKTAIVNGLPVVRFDGSNDVLSNTNCVLSPNAGSIFIAARPAYASPDGVSQHGPMLSHTRVGVPGTLMDVWHTRTDDGHFIVRYNVTSSLTASRTWSANTHHLFYADYDFTGDIAHIRLDGGTSSARTFGENVPDLEAGGDFHIGVGEGGFLADFFAGDIMEILCYSGVLSDSNRQIIESYIRAKWGTP